MRRAAEGADPARGTAALQKGFRILDVVGGAGGSAGFTEIVRAARLPKATVHRLLAALLEGGLLRFDARDGRYRFGWKLIEYGRFAQADLDLPSLVDPELARLHHLTGETVLLALPHGPDVICAKAVGPGGSGALAEGTVLPGHLSAPGRAILAFTEPRARPAPRAPLDAAALEGVLDVAKARRYAIEDRGRADLTGVAAPILDGAGRAVGALAVYGPGFRLDPDRLHEIAADVVRAAARVAGQTAFTQPSARRANARADAGARCAVPARAFLGEGPVWDAAAGRLRWLDILAPALHASDPATGTTDSVALPEIVGAFAPRRAGGFVVGAQSGFALFEPQTGTWTALGDPEAERPGNRFNDGKCDSRGRFWAGTMDMGVKPGAGALYRLDPDGGVHRMETGIGISNGLGWSPDDRRLYFTDSLARTIYVYDFDASSGAIANRRVFAQAAEHMGVPDGLAVDVEGGVWSAQWDGWQVVRYDPDGAIERTVALPVPRPTSCCFGGPDLATLFVTSARIRLSAAQLAEAPLSGSVLALDPGVQGLSEHAFAG